MKPVDRLRRRLNQSGILIMPCCFDALSARLIEQAGFDAAFMSGFAVSATRLALPDTGLISYGEMAGQGRDICAAVDIPVIGDGDTGYGNPVNARRTVTGYAQAGFAGILIEDQTTPKRCGHIRGKQVVARAEALQRLRAALDARAALRDQGGDMVVIARTDACAVHGLDEALARLSAFAEIGADILFLEAPRNEEAMARFCNESPGLKMANMLEGGDTPILPPQRLEEIGFSLAAYPLTLLASAVAAMRKALADLAAGRPATGLTPFAELRELAGFDDYDFLAARYRTEKDAD